MKLTHSVVKVSNITISRQWYSSLLFEDTSQSGDGRCSWKSGLTIISEEQWHEYFSLLGDSQNTNAIVLGERSGDLGATFVFHIHSLSLTTTASNTTTCTNCSATSFSVQNPYTVVYMYKRTA